MTWGWENTRRIGRTSRGSEMRSADPFRKLDVGDANPMIYVNRSESSEFVYSDICPTSRHTYGKADPCERSTRVENKQVFLNYKNLGGGKKRMENKGFFFFSEVHLTSQFCSLAASFQLWCFFSFFCVFFLFLKLKAMLHLLASSVLNWSTQPAMLPSNKSNPRN